MNLLFAGILDGNPIFLFICFFLVLSAFRLIDDIQKSLFTSLSSTISTFPFSMLHLNNRVLGWSEHALLGELDLGAVSDLRDSQDIDTTDQALALELDRDGEESLGILAVAVELQGSRRVRGVDRGQLPDQHLLIVIHKVLAISLSNCGCGSVPMDITRDK